MSVRIRMQRKGRKKRPFYRIVAAHREAPRDGRFIEMLGTYNPMEEPPALNLKLDRVEYWLEHGATTSDTVNKLIAAAQTGVDGLSRSKPSTLRRGEEKKAEREAAAKEAEAEKAAAAEAEKAAAAEAEAQAADAEPEAEASEEESSDEE